MTGRAGGDAAGANHWATYHRQWAQLAPPLRPTAAVAAAVVARLPPMPGDVLLLGVTPELAHLAGTGGMAGSLVAVDRSAGMIAGVWPGDTAHRRAVCGDWLAMPLSSGRFRGAVGDASLNVLTYPEGYRIALAEVARVLRPGGRLVLRVFATPPDGDSVADVLAGATAARDANFHAFKWRLAMALASEPGGPTVRVQTIRDSFVGAYRDRGALCAATGWARADVDTIDVYAGSWVTLSFPTLDQLQAVLPAAFSPPVVLPFGDYPLAERCPLVVLERHG